MQYIMNIFMQRQGKITIKKLELYLELLAFKKNYISTFQAIVVTAKFLLGFIKHHKILVIFLLIHRGRCCQN